MSVNAEAPNVARITSGQGRASSIEDTAGEGGVLSAAVRYLQDQLWAPDGQAAVHYLTHTRAIPPTVARDYRVGYLPRSGDGTPSSLLTDALRAAGVSDDALISAGLTIERYEGGPLIDKPQGGGYLALPLCDPQGTLIGIKYRAIPGLAGANARRFDATSGALSGALFGLDRLSPQSTTVIATEGELDQLSLAAAREVDPTLPPAIALHGNGLSVERVKLLTGRVQHVLLMLDADDGGFDGLLRGGRKLAHAGIGVSVFRMPEGIDPNDLLCAGDAHGLAYALRHLQHVSLFEEHARSFTRFGPRRVNLARSEPSFVASELRETAAALAGAQLDSEAVARGSELVGLDSRHFAPYVTDAQGEHEAPSQEEAHCSPRVADYDVQELLCDAIDVVDDAVEGKASVSLGV